MERRSLLKKVYSQEEGAQKKKLLPARIMFYNTWCKKYDDARLNNIGYYVMDGVRLTTAEVAKGLGVFVLCFEVMASNLSR